MLQQQQLFAENRMRHIKNHTNKDAAVAALTSEHLAVSALKFAFALIDCFKRLHFPLCGCRTKSTECAKTTILSEFSKSVNQNNASNSTKTTQQSINNNQVQ